jgi:signal transduction histidine kinase
MRAAGVAVVNSWFLVPLLSGLVCLASGLGIAARDPGGTSHRCMAVLLIGACWWGVCESVWTLAPDPATALLWVRLSAPGWIAVGPLCMHLFLAQDRRLSPRSRPGVGVAYGVAACALVVEWTTPWMHPGVLRVPWGWAYRVGPAYGIWLGFTILCSSFGVLTALRELRAGASPAEARQSPWLGASVSAPLFVGSMSDGLLPLLGVQLPRLGVASFAVLGTLVMLSIQRFGWSLVAPGSVAGRILDAMPEGIALVAPDGRVRFVNPGLANLLGQPGEGLLERHLAAFLPGVSFPGESLLREHECELEQTGGKRIPVALSATPLCDKQGALLGVVLVLRDLREVVSLRTRLLTSARLAAVGELAAGIAHEINNPLAYVGTNLRALRQLWSELADAKEDGPPEARVERLGEGLEMLDESLEGVERTAAIVRDVRVFSHGGREGHERLDPNDLVDRALRMAEIQLRHQARVVRETNEVPLVEGVRRELEQVLLNLLINAAQALDGPGTVRVRTAVRDGAVEITVADDGRGIPPELLDRIFDPFFTTKPAGEGTGLGLSISHEIVRRHGGRIDVDSRPGRGTEFRVRLPVAAA